MDIKNIFKISSVISIVLFVIFVLVLVFLTIKKPKEEIQFHIGKIIKYYDGDTFLVYDKNIDKKIKVRVLGIDYPDPKDYRRVHLFKERYGVDENILKFCYYKYNEILSNILTDAEVLIIFDEKEALKDKYGRYLAYVYVNCDKVKSLIKDGFEEKINKMYYNNKKYCLYEDVLILNGLAREYDPTKPKCTLCNHFEELFKYVLNNNIGCLFSE
jgi:endonuclease YncB( thermonuclease family)